MIPFFLSKIIKKRFNLRFLFKSTLYLMASHVLKSMNWNFTCILIYLDYYALISIYIPIIYASCAYSFAYIKYFFLLMFWRYRYTIFAYRKQLFHMKCFK